jgi:hypothetical protein
MSSNGTRTFFCAKCLQKFNESTRFLNCQGACGGNFCAYCTGLNKQEFQDAFENENNWVCGGCGKKRLVATPTTNKPRIQSNKTVRTPPLHSNNNTLATADLLTPPEKSLTGVHSTNGHQTLAISTTNASKVNEKDTINIGDATEVLAVPEMFKTLIARLDALTETNNQMNSKLSLMQAHMNDMEIERQKMKEDIQTLQQENKNFKEDIILLNNNNFFVKCQNDDLLSDVNILQQRLLRKNFEISGIPVQPNENLSEMFVKIAEKINVNVNPSQIHQIYRKKTRKLKNGMPPTIIVKLPMNVKEEIMEKKKEVVLNTDIFNETGMQKRTIYINEHMIKEYKYILKRAKDIRRAGKIKYAWFKFGSLFVKKEERGQSIRVLKLQDLSRFDGE